MHLFTLCVIIKATSPMSLIASLVASSNLFCILLYLSIAVLFAGNKSTTTTTTTLSQESNYIYNDMFCISVNIVCYFLIF